MTESRRKIDNCSFHLFVATLENLGPQNRTFTVLKDDNLSFPHIKPCIIHYLNLILTTVSVFGAPSHTQFCKNFLLYKRSVFVHYSVTRNLKERMCIAIVIMVKVVQ